MHGHYNEALEAIPQDKCDEDGGDRLIFLLERARIKQALGDFEGSNQDFEIAYQMVEAFDGGPSIGVSNILEEAGALLTNETTLPYRGVGYEKVLIPTFKAINYFMLKDVDGARVEIKRLDKRLMIEQEKHEKEIAEAEELSKKNVSDLNRSYLETIVGDLPESVKNELLGGGGSGKKGQKGEAQDASVLSLQDQFYKAMGSEIDEASKLRSLYLSPFGSYLSSMLYDIEGDWSDVRIDNVRVLEGAPGFSYAMIDAVSVVEPADLNLLQDRVPSLPPVEPGFDLSKRGDLVLFFQCGMAPEKQEIKIAIPVPAIGVMTTAFPVYQRIPTRLASAILLVDGEIAGETEILNDISAQAIKTLVDQIPSTIIRGIFRAIAKGTASYIAGQTGGGYAMLGASLYNYASEQADLRSWLTLPKNIQALRSYPAEGEHSVQVALLDVEGNIVWQSEEQKLNFANDSMTVANIIATGLTTLYPEGVGVSQQWVTMKRTPLLKRPNPVLSFLTPEERSKASPEGGAPLPGQEKSGITTQIETVTEEADIEEGASGLEGAPEVGGRVMEKVGQESEETTEKIVAEEDESVSGVPTIPPAPATGEVTPESDITTSAPETPEANYQFPEPPPGLTEEQEKMYRENLEKARDAMEKAREQSGWDGKSPMTPEQQKIYIESLRNASQSESGGFFGAIP